MSYLWAIPLALVIVGAALFGLVWVAYDPKRFERGMSVGFGLAVVLLITFAVAQTAKLLAG